MVYYITVMSSDCIISAKALQAYYWVDLQKRLFLEAFMDNMTEKL